MVNSNNFCLLIGALIPFTFKVTIDIINIYYILLLFSTCCLVLCSIFFHFFSDFYSFNWAFYTILFSILSLHINYFFSFLSSCPFYIKSHNYTGSISTLHLKTAPFPFSHSLYHCCHSLHFYISMCKCMYTYDMYISIHILVYCWYYILNSYDN